MKTISKILSIAMLLGTSLQPAAYAQNLNKQIDNAENVALDYLISNEYILTGDITPGTVGGMPNVGPFAGNLNRLQLQKIDYNLNTQWAKTFAVADEVATVQQGLCNSLSNSFYVGDVKQTKDEGFIICGEVRRDPETSGCGYLGNYDHLFLLKTDKDGNVQWFKRYDKYGMLNSVVETPNGDFIACGRLGGAGVSTGLIIYTDAGGNLQWSKEALTPAFWDHTIPSNGSEYYEVINFNGNFAVVGIANYVGTVWAGTNITVVDALGNVLQNSVIDNQIYGYTLSARAIADAHDGEVVITGMAGTPCQTGAQVFILKIEPYSMGVNFLRVYSYNNKGDASMGTSIDVDGSKRIFLTGIDWTTIGGGGLYLETDYAGNLNRYTPFNATEATWGKGIVYNPAMGVPTFSGFYSPNMQSTFIIRDDQNKDCSPDIYMPDYTTPYEVYGAKDQDPGVKSIDDKAYDFTWDPKEGIACGKPKPGSTTSVANVTATTLALSPNPASEYLDVNLGISMEGSTLKVYDITGRALITRTLENGTSIRINTASLLPGTYTLNIAHKNGTVSRSNFIKE